MWAAIERGRLEDPPADESPDFVASEAGDADRDASNDDVIRMEPISESAPLVQTSTDALVRPASASASPSPSPSPPDAVPRRRARASRKKQQAIFYRVTKRTSTIAFLERIFENELDERQGGPRHAPYRPPQANVPPTHSNSERDSV